MTLIQKRVNLRSLTLVILLLAASAFAQRSYTTTFPANETPISENHNWVNEGSCGDPLLCPGAGSSNINTNAGVAHGTQSGVSGPPYLDSGALVTGSWGATQSVQIVVYWDKNTNTDNDYDETEIRLRNTFFSNGHGQGYNINCRTGTPNSNSYVQMGRFNADGTFTAPFAQLNGAAAGCTNGDVLIGTVANNASGQPVITFYKNGTKIIQGTDTGGAAALQSGNPGMGFYHQCASQPCGSSNGSNSDFGISKFTATDTGNSAPAAPTGLTATVH
jgi:hypothetical protein